MTLNKLLDILIKMNRNTEVNGETEAVIEYDGPDALAYLSITHVKFNEVNNQIQLIHDHGISAEAWAEELKNKRNNPL